MGKNILRDKVKQHNTTLLSANNYRKLRKIFIISCLIALVLSFLVIYIETQNNLRKSCTSVAEDFTSIMYSYQHSFCLFELLLQQEILNAENTAEIESFLKEQDDPLLAIEGSDYDGVYMYYQNHYLYSWDTPYEVYRDSGYDATQRPWYIGAVAAKGEIFFSVPYPSYANDYMLATISRLQPDGQTVIAYDIKLGEIGKYVDKLDIYNGALTLICDTTGNIIGSTEHLYQGGNYRFAASELQEQVSLAQQEYAAAVEPEAQAKALKKVASAEAQLDFCTAEYEYLTKMLNRQQSIQFKLNALTFGYAYTNEQYTCFIITPLSKLLPRVAVLWAALSFMLILAALLITSMLRRNSQVLTDSLTGLNNRRALIKYCNNHITHHAEEELYLIMLDLNYFKQINDQAGHIAGDQALLDTADALKKACGAAPCNFFLCRYGGDEFLLAGTNCSQHDIEQTKKLITDNLTLKNQSGNKPYVLEAGIGVSGGKCPDKSHLEQLLVQADKAMYEEKNRMKQNKASSRL